MKEEEKSEEIEKNDISNEKKIIDNDANTNFGTNNSEVLRHVNREKIKINEEKLKDVKEQTMEIKSDISGAQSQNTIDIATKNNNALMQSTASISDNTQYYSKINRFLTARMKKNILIAFLCISVCFVLISAFDILNYTQQIVLMNDNQLENFVEFDRSTLVFKGMKTDMLSYSVGVKFDAERALEFAKATGKG